MDLTHVKKKSLLLEDRIRCAADVHRARNYKHYHELQEEAAKCTEMVETCKNSMEILADHEKLFKRQQVLHGASIMDHIQMPPVLTYPDFRKYLYGTMNRSILEVLFGRQTPPTLDVAQDVFQDDTFPGFTIESERMDREQWILMMTDGWYLRDESGLLRLMNKFLIEFSTGDVLNGWYTRDIEDDEPMPHVWWRMLEYMRPMMTSVVRTGSEEYQRARTGRYDILVHVNVLQLISNLRQGHINVDEYVRGVSNIQYRVELAHATYIQTYRIAYALFDILNDGYRALQAKVEDCKAGLTGFENQLEYLHRGVPIDSMRIVNAIRALQDETKVIQDASRHMPWLDATYTCPLPYMRDILYYSDKYVARNSDQTLCDPL